MEISPAVVIAARSLPQGTVIRAADVELQRGVPDLVPGCQHLTERRLDLRLDEPLVGAFLEGGVGQGAGDDVARDVGRYPLGEA